MYLFLERTYISWRIARSRHRKHSTLHIVHHTRYRVAILRRCKNIPSNTSSSSPSACFLRPFKSATTHPEYQSLSYSFSNFTEALSSKLTSPSDAAATDSVENWMTLTKQWNSNKRSPTDFKTCIHSARMITENLTNYIKLLIAVIFTNQPKKYRTNALHEPFGELFLIIYSST